MDRAVVQGAPRRKAALRPAARWRARGLALLASVTAVAPVTGCYGGFEAEPEAGLDEPPPGAATSSESSDDPSGEAPELPPSAENCELPPPRLRRLTPPQYDRTVAALVASLDGAPSDGFINTWEEPAPLLGQEGSLSLNTPHVAQLQLTAEALGQQIAADPGVVHPCMPAGAADTACVDDFVEQLLRRSFRREPTDEEQRSYAGFFAAQRAEFDDEAALTLTAQRALMSPDFLFRTELGDGSDTTTLDPFERASLVSYLLTDGPPDEPMYADALSGDLLDAEVMAEHAERLLSSRPTSAGLLHFMKEYLHYDDVTSKNKDAELFPAFDDALAADMVQETAEFVAEVLWQDDGTLRTLLTADYSVVNDRLAALYGVEGASGEEFSRVELPPERRAGVLGHGSFLAAHANFDKSSLAFRGLHITTAFLCRPIPPPPQDVQDANFNLDDPNKTQREQWDDLLTEARCRACHAQSNPLGFPFEAFDAIGAYRETDNGMTLDLTMQFPPEIDPQETMAENSEQFARRLAELDATQECLADRVYTYSQGRQPNNDSCQRDDLRDLARETGGDVIEMFISMVTDDAFFWRSTEQGDS